MKQYVLIASGLVLSILIGTYLGTLAKPNNTPTSTPTPTPTETPVGVLDPDASVTSPTAGSTVSSPLTVEGSAIGSWFFEGQLPATLVDANGNEIARTPLQAKGDWTTDQHVDFSGTLTFSTPETETGFLRVAKDNPSGLTDNDSSISVPVRFK